jgi:hypothetical protein
MPITNYTISNTTNLNGSRNHILRLYDQYDNEYTKVFISELNFDIQLKIDTIINEIEYELEYQEFKEILGL